MTISERAQKSIDSSVSTPCDNAKVDGGDSDISFASSGEEQSETNENTAILDLHKVTVLQEIQDASIRRLDVLMRQITESASFLDTGDTKVSSFILPLGEKLCLMQDYLKVSLHLLESRLSNEIESAKAGISIDRGILELDDAMLLRFNRIEEVMKEIENQSKESIELLTKEVEHQDIKISAKDTVIERLLSTERKLKDEVNSMQAEIDVFKGLQSFSSVNIGVMARFKECAKLEDKLKEKNEIIRYLKKEIDELRDDGGSN